MMEIQHDCETFSVLRKAEPKPVDGKKNKQKVEVIPDFSLYKYIYMNVRTNIYSYGPRAWLIRA